MAAALTVSPNSILPPGKPHKPASGGLARRTSKALSSWMTTAMTAGMGDGDMKKARPYGPSLIAYRVDRIE